MLQTVEHCADLGKMDHMRTGLKFRREVFAAGRCAIFFVFFVYLSGCGGASEATAQKPSVAISKLHPAAEQLKILEPAEGTVLKHGEKVRVTVQVPANFKPRDGVLIGIGVENDLVSEPPYVATLVVPDDVIGTVSIAALAVNSNGATAGALVNVKVEPAEPLTGLAFPQDRLRMFPEIISRKPLRLDGIYANGRRGLLSPDVQVKYEVDDPEIAMVDEEGYVTAKAYGRTRAHATWGEFTATIEIIVAESD